MGIISKAFTFIAGTLIESSKVNSDFDTIYNEFNGAISDANISATANIAQSKIASLVADLAARVAKAGDTMTGNLSLQFANPNIWFKSTGPNVHQWLIQADANGFLDFYWSNQGNPPVWNLVYRLNINGMQGASDLANKNYVDTLAALYTNSNAISKVVVDGADFVTNSTNFVGVPFLATTLPVRSRRVQVTLNACVYSGDASDVTIYVTLLVDGSDVGDGGLSINTVSNGRIANASFTYITDLLSNATHTFEIFMRVSSGSGSIATGTPAATLTVMELPI